MPTAFVGYYQHYQSMTSKKDDPTQANTADSKLEKDIGEAIVMLRRQAHMTQEDLAGAAEIDRSYLSEIENGRKNISIRVLDKIARALKTDITDFFKTPPSVG